MTYYDLLGVPPTADHDAIRRAYKRVAKASHPDRNPGDAKAQELFIAAAQAWEILGDATTRALYDLRIAPAVTTRPRRPRAPAAGGAPDDWITPIMRRAAGRVADRVVDALGEGAAELLTEAKRRRSGG